MSEDGTYLPSARRPRPGRPRKVESGHAPGTSLLQVPDGAGAQARTLALHAVAPIAPRLLDLPAAAAYLGVSPWTVRDLEAAGTLRRVRLPLPNGGELRKLLFDREDLDRCIVAWKDG